MDLVSSLSHTCILSIFSDPCLHPGEHLKDRIHPQVADAPTKRKRDDDAFGTWMARGAEWVTLGRYGDSTVVYLPSQDAFYYAGPASMLSPACPDRTVFLGQFVVDDDSTPRILVHDLVRLQGVPCADMPPRERYACLQQMGGLLGPACTLQWVGECRVLCEDLRSGKFKVPHAVRGVVALTSVPGRVVDVAM